jgi:hypothetical protein
VHGAVLPAHWVAVPDTSGLLDSDEEIF